MLARSFALALLVTGTITASAATDDEIRQQILGKWGETAECTGSALIFNADGTFVMTGGGGEDTTGTYTIANGKLNGNTTNGPMPEVAPSIEGEQLMLAGEGGNPDGLFKCK